jgi:ribosome-binding ATPase
MSKNLEIGIVGLPNVGKSTIFNILTDGTALAANYPFATIEPNSGTVAVPDERLQKLAELYKTTKIIPASITFTDIAGLVAGASKGEGLGNQFLGHIRSTALIVHVVRAFNDSNVLHVDAVPSPKKDIETINTELMLADLQSIDKKIPKLEKESRTDPKLKNKLEQLIKAKKYLDQEKMINSLKDEDFSELDDLNLITLKPQIFLFNIDENDLSNETKKTELKNLVPNYEVVYISAKLENELRELDKSDARELLESYGQTENGLTTLIKSAYKALGLQSYLTAGEKEVRAWTIHIGDTAPKAAGVIHGDFEKGFIAAEVVDYKALIEAGSMQAAKSAGKVRTEGKNYILQPDDVVEFRFNV